VRPAPPPPREVSVPKPPSPVVKPPTPPEATPASETSADPLRKARDYSRSNPYDFAGQLQLYELALSGMRAGPAVEQGRRELAGVRRTARERIDAELPRLDQRTRDYCVSEEFDQALEALEGARRRLNAPDWSAAIQKRVDEVHRYAAEL